MPRRKTTRTPDHRIRRRNETARMVEVPEGAELTRRPNYSEGPGAGMKAAVLAALLLGEPVAQIATQYGIAYQTVYEWSRDFDITNPVKRRDQLSEDLVTFVRQEIANLMAISIATSRDEWIIDQPAGELAQYVAVKTENLMKILQAFGKVSESKQQFSSQVVEIEE